MDTIMLITFHPLLGEAPCVCRRQTVGGHCEPWREATLAPLLAVDVEEEPLARRPFSASFSWVGFVARLGGVCRVRTTLCAVM